MITTTAKTVEQNYAAIEAAQAELKAAKRPKPEASEKCEQCNGRGEYVWGAVVNGVPSHTGTCYRCGGKGFQTGADRRRNAYYDNRVRRI